VTLAELRAVAEALPDGASLTLPRAALLALCATERASLDAVDLTVAQVAAMQQRSSNTVRRWLERGQLDGYRLAGGAGDWRVTRDALDRFRAAGARPKAGAGLDLGSWRDILAKGKRA
jgi:excisionase family DNA binding protein